MLRSAKSFYLEQQEDPMTNDAPSRGIQAKQEIKRGVVKRLVQVVLLVVFEASVLFLAAGRLDWV